MGINSVLPFCFVFYLIVNRMTVQKLCMLYGASCDVIVLRLISDSSIFNPVYPVSTTILSTELLCKHYALVHELEKKKTVFGVNNGVILLRVNCDSSILIPFILFP